MLLTLKYISAVKHHNAFKTFFQEVNENSLKRLNGYLENLQKPGARSVIPTKLTFYVRDTKAKADIEQDLLPSGMLSFRHL